MSYVRLVIFICPNKLVTNYVRFAAGRDVLDYPGTTSIDTAILTTTNILPNGVISALDAMFCDGRQKYFYHNNPLIRFEYMWMELAETPEEVILQYHLEKFASHWWVCIEILNGMPGLKQAGKVANERLVEHISKYDYATCKRTQSLWRHASRPVVFTLCVDGFGVKYIGKQHGNHLLDALCASYNMTCDWTGSSYLFFNNVLG